MTQKAYTRSVATNMVIANMIGTGIFTSIGFQVMPGGIPDAFTILMIWLLGGLFALCGATVYAEVATTIRQSGGEYTFLSKLYHPVFGLASGWISLVVGFSAAIASLALAAGAYLNPVAKLIFSDNSLQYAPKIMGLTLILIVTLIQLKGIKTGGLFQNIFTAIKLIFIVILILTPLLLLDDDSRSHISFLPTDKSWSMIGSMSFAGSLVWVMFAYSGWNASAYIAGNLNEPKKNLPFSLLTGTGIVTLIYLALTFIFMFTCSFDELAGNVDVGNLVINKVFGKNASLWFGALFALTLISGINAMYIAGPRVTQKMGFDYKTFGFLKDQSKNGAPITAILIQTFISSLLVIFSDFKNIVEYIGLTLSIFSLLTVIGVFILRAKKLSNPDTVKTWGYPVTPVVFIIVTLWMITYFVMQDPMKLVWSIATILPAFAFYYYSKLKK